MTLMLLDATIREEAAADTEPQSTPALNVRPARGATFRDRFCEAFGCPDASFEMEVLERALPPLHKALFRAIHGLRPRHFNGDAHAIARLGSATTQDEFTTGIGSVQYSFRQDHPVLRSLCRTRVSGKRLLQLYHTAFSPHGAKVARNYFA